jgi:cobalt-zinc-cadmium efflux system protein
MPHDHDHRAPADLGPAFRWAVGLNAAYVIVEGMAGWMTGSSALPPLPPPNHVHW